ncbi:MAG: hypothetical protein JSR34_00455 [Proteobacteria bacterium]|nr:hypothetical protein [Pseudomonadota bacterium]
MTDGPSDVSALDLSALPEPARTAVMQQLARMPAPLREKLLREGSPFLNRLIAKFGEPSGHGTAALPATAAESAPGRGVIGGGDAASQARAATLNRILDSKRMPTVSPGDAVNHTGWFAIIGAALIAAVAWAMYG